MSLSNRANTFLPDGETCFAGLIGNPISHSLSPRLHSSWFQNCGLNAVYLPLPLTDKNDLSSLILSLTKLSSFLGANITTPFKQDVLQIPSLKKSERVQAAGAANTLYKNKEGEWLLENTDIVGILESLKTIRSTPKCRLLILGGGGAARATVAAAALVPGCIQAEVIARDPEKVIQEWGPAPFQNEDQWLSLHAMSYSSLESLVQHSQREDVESILINTLPLGHAGEANLVAKQMLELFVGLEKPCAYFDMIYKTTEAVEIAIKNKLKAIDGRLMLESQARESFKLWTGQDPLTAQKAG